MITYPIPGSDQYLVLTPNVLQRFTKYQQTRWWHREAGGQLFARFHLPRVTLEEATGPRRSDWRTRYSYHPNRRAEQREIADRHPQDLHFVGDWHTHPEPIPEASTCDADSMRELVAKSKHALNGFIMIIVGTESFPTGLSVAFYTRAHRILLHPLAI